jgi:hypothetical protein
MNHLAFRQENKDWNIEHYILAVNENIINIKLYYCIFKINKKTNNLTILTHINVLYYTKYDSHKIENYIKSLLVDEMFYNYIIPQKEVDFNYISTNLLEYTDKKSKNYKFTDKEIDFVIINLPLSTYSIPNFNLYN